jgi:hypothetical protein
VGHDSGHSDKASSDDSFPDPEILLRYERKGEIVRLSLKNMTNHEIREILIGLWCRLDLADRIDHINGLVHYSTDEDAWLGPVAVALKNAHDGNPGVVNLRALIEKGEKVRP